MYQLCRSWWKIRFKIKTPSVRSCQCYCHAGPRVVLKSTLKKGRNSQQVTKKHKKERSSCPAVLNLFDQQYSEELGDLWPPARTVLLDPYSWQYGIMLNRFSTATDITQILHSQGFSTLLLQTDVSLSKYQEIKNITLSSVEASKFPPCDTTLQSDSTSPLLYQDLKSEPTSSLSNPSLQCYIHSRPVRFPSQAHRPGQLKQYYLLNAASLLPVLALQVKDGDKVLDLCSAPGGKAIAILQSANPALLCCNEPDPHRRDWLAKTLESFLPQTLHSTVIVSAQDGRTFDQRESGLYDKVLVDAPCSNDRSWLHSNSNQQGEQRLQDRTKLPAVQVQLLKSALLAVRPGGFVVYSTCTLSSFENFAVVETVLNDFPEAELEDLWDEIAVPLSPYFAFSSHPGRGQTTHKPSLQPLNSTGSSYHRRLGILVVPQPGKTWGPMFLSRIRRRKQH